MASNVQLDRCVRLRDGRSLAFSQFGDLDGSPLFFFHGAGSTRLTRHPDDAILSELGVRLITVDRPGVGRSDARPGGRLLDWPCDVSQLADALAIDRFGVLGWSAGGPFALACAYLIPARVQAVGVMSGMAPLHWPSVRAALTATCGRMAGLGERLRARGVVRCAGTAAYPAHRTEKGVRPTEVRAVNRQRLPELLRTRQWKRAGELAMLARPWGFHLGEIEPVVHVWHGSRDRLTPLYMAEYVVRAIPRAVLTVFPDEGHHAGFTHWREVLHTLADVGHHGVGPRDQGRVAVMRSATSRAIDKRGRES